MAVLVTNADGNLSDANRFNTVISSNLGCSSLTTLALDLPQVYAATFSGAANLKGIGLFLTANNNSIDRSVYVSLQQINATCTMTIASPCVVTLAGHGYLGGETIMLATTGALPTGLSQNTIYYIKYIDANTFNLSLTSGGANINTSGSQSGTHTVWTIRAGSTLTYSQICGSQTNRIGYYITAFDFASVYAVDTTANKWRISMIQTGGTTGTWKVNCSNYPHTMANLFHVAYTDTNATFSSGNDAICVRHYLTIDMSATLLGVAGLNDQSGSTRRYACIIFSNPSNPAPADVSYLKWQNPASAAYTLTLNGSIHVPSYGGFRIGTEADPITAANKATITYTGTAPCGIFSVGDLLGSTSSNGYNSENSSLFMYGATPTYRSSLINGTAAAAQKNIVTDDSTGWNVGDTVFYGPLDTTVLPTSTNTINTIAGTAIGLTNNLSHALMDNGVIFVKNGYGIEIIGSASVRLNINISSAANCFVQGCYMFETTLNTRRFNLGYSTNYPPNAGNYSAITFKNCVMNGTVLAGMLNNTPNVAGLLISGVYTHKIAYAGSSNGVDYTSATPCGASTVENCIGLNSDSTQWLSSGGTFGTKFKNLTISNIKTYNVVLSAQFPLWVLVGSNITVQNNTFYGCQLSGGTDVYEVVSLSNLVQSTFSGNKFDKCSSAYKLISNAYVLNIAFGNENFGSISANTNDLECAADGYCNMQFNNPVGAVNFNTTNFDNCVYGSRVAVVAENNTEHKDTTYFVWGKITKTGGSLADTTTRLGSGYAWKLTPTQTNGTDLFVWPGSDNANKQVIPSGNIQNKSPAIGIWVKINNAAYYAGTHTKPTLVVNYDNGTTVEVAATASTSWQRLAVSFTPLTTYGQYSWYLKAATDATGTNRNFYFDDFQNTYPNATVDLGNLDLSANGEPVFPPVALNIISSAVGWDQRAADFNTDGTFGNFVNRILQILRRKI